MCIHYKSDLLAMYCTIKAHSHFIHRFIDIFRVYMENMCLNAKPSYCYKNERGRFFSLFLVEFRDGM